MSEKTKDKDKKVLGVYLSEDIKDKLIAEAKKNHRSVSAEAALILEERMKKNKEHI